MTPTKSGSQMSQVTKNAWFHNGLVALELQGSQRQHVSSSWLGRQIDASQPIQATSGPLLASSSTSYSLDCRLESVSPGNCRLLVQ